MAISIALFRISNTYGGTDIVNNQQFNESRLRHISSPNLDTRSPRSAAARYAGSMGNAFLVQKQDRQSHPESMFHIWYFLSIFVGCKQIIIKRIDI